MKLEVLRFPASLVQTLSLFEVYDDYELKVFSGVMLELPDRDNQRRISRINAGSYTCNKRFSEKYGNHFIVEDVDGRDYILIHHGNYHSDTHGCLLAGKKFKDLNNDGYEDVTNSRDTMRKLNHIMPDSFELEIFNSELDLIESGILKDIHETRY
tara:strand:- start:2124 stop:2588 length:465 start_codon:yes stop_codon:yes gene_type:complete